MWYWWWLWHGHGNRDGYGNGDGECKTKQTMTTVRVIVCYRRKTAASLKPTCVCSGFRMSSESLAQPRPQLHWADGASRAYHSPKARTAPPRKSCRHARGMRQPHRQSSGQLHHACAWSKCRRNPRTGVKSGPMPPVPRSTPRSMPRSALLPPVQRSTPKGCMAANHPSHRDDCPHCFDPVFHASLVSCALP